MSTIEGPSSNSAPLVESGDAIDPSALRALLATLPAGSLLSALEDRPGVGWLVKHAQSLRYAGFKGSLPHADATVCHDTALLIGQTDVDRFERAQASILRLADLRVLQAGRPVAEDHRFETHRGTAGDGTREWRAWRWSDGRWLLTVWIDMDAQARHDAEIEQARRQLQAQQLLIARMTAQIQEPAASGGSTDWVGLSRSLRWSGEHFGAQLRREVDLSRREHRNLALLLLEVDTQGLPEQARTAAIGMVAQQLASSTRAMDTVAQVDETRFGILLSGAALSPAHARAEALRRQIAAQVVVAPGMTRGMALSIGLAAYPHGASTAEELMDAARGALQEATTDGGNRTVMARVPLGRPPA